MQNRTYAAEVCSRRMPSFSGRCEYDAMLGFVFAFSHCPRSYHVVIAVLVPSMSARMIGALISPRHSISILVAACGRMARIVASMNGEHRMQIAHNISSRKRKE